MNKKKILIFLTTAYPYGNGESFIETEINYLSKSFDKIFIISNGLRDSHPVLFPDNVSAEKYPYYLTKKEIFKSFYLLFGFAFLQEFYYLIFRYHKFPSFRIIKTIILSFLYGHKLARYIKNHLKDISSETDDVFVYSYWFNDNSIGVALLKKYLPDIKGFSRAHAYDLYFYRSPTNYIPFKNLLFRKLDFVFFISDDAFNYSKNILKISNKFLHKTSISRLGISQSIKKLYGVEEKKCLNIVSCSYIYFVKRLDLLIESIGKIDSFNIKWIHFGDGRTTEEFENTKKLAFDKLKNKKNIEFKFFGFLNNEDILNYYKENPVDVFINLSTNEGIPVTFMEVMSYGIPVIATAVGGSVEIVKNEYNGFLLSENPSSIEVADAIEYFYKLSDNEIQILRSNAYTTWNELYNADKNYTKFVNDIISL